MDQFLSDSSMAAGAHPGKGEHAGVNEIREMGLGLLSLLSLHPPWLCDSSKSLPSSGQFSLKWDGPRSGIFKLIFSRRSLAQAISCGSQKWKQIKQSHQGPPPQATGPRSDPEQLQQFKLWASSPRSPPRASPDDCKSSRGSPLSSHNPELPHPHPHSSLAFPQLTGPGNARLGRELVEGANGFTHHLS